MTTPARATSHGFAWCNGQPERRKWRATSTDTPSAARTKTELRTRDEGSRKGLTIVLRRALVLPRWREHALRDAAERTRQLARDHPHLVRVALRDLRQHLQVLVREELRVGIPVVDRLEHRLDRLRLALRGEDRRLLLPLGL